MDIMKNILKLIPIFIISFALAHQVQAASLSFIPSSGPYFVGDRFSVSIFVSSADQAMNAISADISFSQERLELLSISQAGSIIGFWAQEPVYSNQSGEVFFEGVVLNGYQGTAGKIVTLAFRALASGEATLYFSSGVVLANDGLGTKIPSNFGSAKFNISALKKKEEVPVPVFEIPEEIPPGFEFSKDLNTPDKDIEVAYLQICLRQEEIYIGEITGVFDSITRDAVVRYQEKYFKDILVPWGFTRGTGLIRKTTRDQLNITCFIPIVEEQLFDINLEIDDNTVGRAKDLLARAIFTSFGTVPTSVDLTFRILDETRDEVYISKDKITVETEAVFTKEFKYLDLPVGRYRLELTTLYNIDVEDKFFADFEITGEIIEEEPAYCPLIIKYWIWISLVIFLAIIIILLLIILILLVHKQHRYIKEKEDMLSDIRKRLSAVKKHSNLSKTEKALLRRLQRDLSELERRVKEDGKSKNLEVIPGQGSGQGSKK